MIEDRFRTIYDDRCLAVTGTAMSGPHFCGNPSKGRDANGRPTCGVHGDKQVGTEWFGDRRHYPYGTGDQGAQWEFDHGVSRTDTEAVLQSHVDRMVDAIKRDAEGEA